MPRHAFKDSSEEVDFDLFLKVDRYVTTKNNIEELWELKRYQQVQLLKLDHAMYRIGDLVAAAGGRKVFAYVLLWQATFYFHFGVNAESRFGQGIFGDVCCENLNIPPMQVGDHFAYYNTD